MTDATLTSKKEMMNDEIAIVIPYLAEAAQGNELELAVTGWRKHFIQPHHFIIVGDSHPIVSSGDDITFMDLPRVKKCEDGNYLPHIDIVKKFIAASMYLSSEGIDHFIYTCDDIYPVNDFSLVEILFPKVVGKMHRNDSDTTGWAGDLQRTRKICEEENLPLWDWVCHLPVFYDINNLLSVIGEYCCFETSYVLENIYFNKTQDNRIPLVLNGSDNLKYEVSTNPLDSFGFDRALQEKIFITNTNSGWSQELEDRLRKHYNK